jgi:transposase-like protein
MRLSWRTEVRNYLCPKCGHRFISAHEMTYRGYLPSIVDLVKIMLVRGIGTGDIRAVLKISIH